MKNESGPLHSAWFTPSAPALAVTIFVTLSSALSSVAVAGTTSADDRPGLCRRLLEGTVRVVDERLSIPAEGPWSLRPETETAIQQVFAGGDLDDTAKIRRVIELMLTDRAQAEGSPLRQRLLRTAMDRAFGRNDWYSKTLGRVFNKLEGAHYSYLSNRVSIADALDAEDPGTTFTYLSLLTQAFNRNYHFARSMVALVLKGWNSGDLVFRLPLAPLLQNRIERSAIGSQWEFARRLPPDVRAQMLKSVAEHQVAAVLPDEDRALFDGLQATGLWARFAHTVGVMQARGDVAAGEVEPVSFFDRPTTLERLRNPLKRRRQDLLRQSVAKAAKKLLKKAERHEAFTGYLVLTEEDLRLAQYLSDPNANRTALEGLIAGRTRAPLDANQRALATRLERDYRARDLTDAQKVAELVVETSLRFANLPKDEFINTVELIYEKDVRHLMHEDLVNPLTKMKIAMALEGAFELTYGGHFFLARDVGIFTHLLAAFF